MGGNPSSALGIAYRKKGETSWSDTVFFDVDGSTALYGVFANCGSGQKTHTATVTEPHPIWGPTGTPSVSAGNYEIILIIEEYPSANNLAYRHYSNIIEYSIGQTNTPPTTSNISATTLEDTSATITLSASDPDPGDTANFSIVTPPDANSGTAYISGKTLIFTPKPNWNGITTLTYMAKDSKGAQSNISTITITVSAVNDAPIAQDKFMEINEDTIGSLILTATDIDSPTPTIFEIVRTTDASHGSVQLDGAKLTFTPVKDWNGSTSLTYRAQDSSGAWSAPATVNITVRPVNDPPVVLPRTLTLNEDTVGKLILTATDVDSNVFSFEVTAQPNHGTVSILGNLLTYTPPADWFGTTTLFYRAKDDAGAWSEPAIINITVAPINDPPVALPLTLTLQEDTEGVVTLKATDIDSLQSFVFELVDLPPMTNGIATILGDQLRFKPAPDWNGTTHLTYRAKDLEGAWSSAAQVIVTVTPVNDRPAQAGKIIIRTIEGVPATVKGTVAN
ncbi:tandem-95 repeat protein [Pseudomonas aeruginosa]|nr:tandem-95 repeat protein [Pseudomonas aeruginosa]ELL4401363.1 tandem-95 repeat protein [Pseudomonas aeruginosa]